jgi:hypothetical protein
MLRLRTATFPFEYVFPRLWMLTPTIKFLLDSSSISSEFSNVGKNKLLLVCSNVKC